jgi:hypothetical protein
MQNTNTNLQKYLPVGIGALLGLLVLFLLTYIFGADKNSQIKYLGADTQNGKSIQNISNENLNPKMIEDTSTAINFTPRKISGGGENWVLALLETQPKTFTGKVIYDNGLKNIDILVDENNGILTGEIKTKEGVQNIRFESVAKKCKDAEGNTFDSTLNGSIGSVLLKGCGGNTVKSVSAE